MSPVQANTRMSDRRGTRAMSPRIRLPPSEGRVEGSRDAEDLVDPPGAAIDGFHDLANAPLPRRLCRPVAPDPQVTAFARRHEPRPGDADVAWVEDTARGASTAAPSGWTRSGGPPAGGVPPANSSARPPSIRYTTPTFRSRSKVVMKSSRPRAHRGHLSVEKRRAVEVLRLHGRGQPRAPERDPIEGPQILDLAPGISAPRA